MQQILTEQDMITDALSTEKQLTKLYATAVSEASCQILRNEITKMFTETQQLQFEVFNALKSRGWYQVKNTETADVQQAVAKFRQVMSNL